MDLAQQQVRGRNGDRRVCDMGFLFIGQQAAGGQD